jgi:hypothetical protein
MKTGLCTSTACTSDWSRSSVDWTVLRPTRFMTSVPFVWSSIVNQDLLRAPAAHAPAMVRYFAKVAAGIYEPTDTAAKVLGRAPRAYAEWLEQNPPAHVRRTL